MLRALRFKRPLHRYNACNPDADAKAELNHRGQACEVLTGTGVRVAKIGRASGNCALYSGLEDRRVSLNTYARWNPVLELHQPLRLCRPPPGLIGQRDIKLKCGRKFLPPSALFP